MFLDGYKRNWLMTEGYSFEDRMIDDLSVRKWANGFAFLHQTVSWVSYLLLYIAVL